MTSYSSYDKEMAETFKYEEWKEKKFDELVEEYFNYGDFWDAVGTADCAKVELNSMWKCYQSNDIDKIIISIRNIMDDAARNYANIMIKK